MLCEYLPVINGLSERYVIHGSEFIIYDYLCCLKTIFWGINPMLKCKIANTGS